MTKHDYLVHTIFPKWSERIFLRLRDAGLEALAARDFAESIRGIVVYDVDKREIEKVLEGIPSGMYRIVQTEDF